MAERTRTERVTVYVTPLQKVAITKLAVDVGETISSLGSRCLMIGFEGELKKHENQINQISDYLESE